MKYEGQYKSNASNFFSENVVAITVILKRMIYTSFAVMGLFFHKVFIIFNPLLPTLVKMLYIIVVNFPALTSEHITSGTGKL
jgi:hypothetical protein